MSEYEKCPKCGADDFGKYFMTAEVNSGAWHHDIDFNICRKCCYMEEEQ